MPHPILLALLLFFAACAPQSNGGNASRTDDSAPVADTAAALAELDSSDARFFAAYTEKNLEDVVGTSTDDIRYVLGGGLVEGKDAVRDAWKKSLRTLSNLKLTPVTRTVRGDLGVVLEKFSQRYQEPGKAAKTDSGYVLRVMRRQPDGRWLSQIVALNRS